MGKKSIKNCQYSHTENEFVRIDFKVPKELYNQMVDHVNKTRIYVCNYNFQSMINEGIFKVLNPESKVIDNSHILREMQDKILELVNLFDHRDNLVNTLGNVIVDAKEHMTNSINDEIKRKVLSRLPATYKEVCTAFPDISKNIIFSTLVELERNKTIVIDKKLRWNQNG